MSESEARQATAKDIRTGAEIEDFQIFMTFEHVRDFLSATARTRGGIVAVNVPIVVIVNRRCKVFCAPFVKKVREDESAFRASTIRHWRMSEAETVKILLRRAF